MRLLHRKTVNEACEAWKEQYFRDGKWGSTISGPADVTYEKFLKTSSPDEWEAVLGRSRISGWTGHWCQSCRKDVAEAVEFEEPDYESGAVICLDCMAEANKLIRRYKRTQTITATEPAESDTASNR